MTGTKSFVFAIVAAVVAAVLAVSLLKPHVDRLSVTLGVGFTEGAPTLETTRFAADMERFLRPADSFAAIALLVVLAGGYPLAVIAMIAHHWPWLFGPLSRNTTVVWVCLTLQMTNVMVPSFFILLFASEGLHAEALIAMLVVMLCAVPNIVAAGVWREMLNRLQVSRFAQATSGRA